MELLKAPKRSSGTKSVLKAGADIRNNTDYAPCLTGRSSRKKVASVNPVSPRVHLCRKDFDKRWGYAGLFTTDPRRADKYTNDERWDVPLATAFWVFFLGGESATLALPHQLESLEYEACESGFVLALAWVGCCTGNMA